jgi:hypothetical protein
MAQTKLARPVDVHEAKAVDEECDLDLVRQPTLSSATSRRATASAERFDGCPGQEWRSSLPGGGHVSTMLMVAREQSCASE